MFAWSYGLGQDRSDGVVWSHRAIHFMVDWEAVRDNIP